MMINGFLVEYIALLPYVAPVAGTVRSALAGQGGMERIQEGDMIILGIARSLHVQERSRRSTAGEGATHRQWSVAL